LPVHAISLGDSTYTSLETRRDGPAFQRKTVPGARSPSSDADFTSGFQLGQPSIVASTSQTISGEAAI
jgi:hypothetical protein